MTIREALSAIPTRPVVYIVPVVVILVLTFYYRDLYTKCSTIRQHRIELNEFLRGLDASTHFRLAEFTRFEWDKVRIVTGLKTGTRRIECPFGWNWDSGERESLIESGTLTAVIFGHRDSIVEYMELSGDDVSFRGVGSSLAPADAVFRVDRATGDDDGVTLTPAD